MRGSLGFKAKDLRLGKAKGLVQGHSIMQQSWDQSSGPLPTPLDHKYRVIPAPPQGHFRDEVTYYINSG